MVRRPSSEANRSSASQETPINLRNTKNNYRILKRPPPAPNLYQMKSTHVLNIHFNINFLSTSWSSKWSPWS